MVNEINIIQWVKPTIETIIRDVTAMGSNVFDVRVGDIMHHECLSTPLNGNRGR